MRMYYGIGNYPQRTPVIIPRQRSGMGVGVPIGPLEYRPSLPGGYLCGADMMGTVLDFDPSITGTLIKTENFNSGKVGHYWNNANALGDTTLRSNICSSISDLTINGRADPTTLNVYRAHGICAQGSGFNAHRVRLFRIPGIALNLLGGVSVDPLTGLNNQAGADGIFDEFEHTVSHIRITAAQHGIVNGAGDSFFHNLIIRGIYGDAFTFNGATGLLELAHFYGCDRGLVFNTPAEATRIYSEASRIGVDFAPGSDGSQIMGLNIGPGTTYYRNIFYRSSGNEVYGVKGSVRCRDDTWTDIAGFEVATGCVHNKLVGALVLAPTSNGNDFTNQNNLNTSVLGYLRGDKGHYDIAGGWNHAFPLGRGIVFKENCKQNDIWIRGTFNKGIAVDLSETTMNGSYNCQGMHIKIRGNFQNGAIPIRYSDGTTTNNLLGARVDIQDTFDP